jgi:hypothetical protein
VDLEENVQRAQVLLEWVRESALINMATKLGALHQLNNYQLYSTPNSTTIHSTISNWM